jgi:hypothetical protein
MSQQPTSTRDAVCEFREWVAAILECAPDDQRVEEMTQWIVYITSETLKNEDSTLERQSMLRHLPE